MDSPGVPTPTRKGTLPGQPLASPGQHTFPPQNSHPQQQYQWSHATSVPPPGPFYGYPNFAQQPQFGQQGFFPGQTPDQQQQQLAQWAFQQMMFNSAQQQLGAMPGVPDFARQRTGSGAAQEYGGFPPGGMLPPHLGFQPSGTPPPHPHPHAGGHALHPMQYSSIGRAAGTDHQAFHPYRRPGGGQPQQRSPSGGPTEFGTQQQFNGQYGTVPFGAGGYPGYPQPQRPYAREMNGSNTSLHSNGSGSGRQRTGSNAGSARTNGSNGGSVTQRGPGPHGPHSHAHSHGHGSMNAHGRNQSVGSSITATSTRPGSDRSVTPPARNTTTSPVSAASGPSPTSATGPSAASGGSTMRPAKPSPLSQQTFATHDPSKRLSRDDSTLEAPNAGLPRSNGLKGRLRRALSFSAVSTLDDAEENKEKLGSRRKAIEKANKANAALQAQGGEASSSGPGAESIRTTTSKKPSRTASLFNRKLNASTDNISLQSTVSSASVMIRRLGSMGNLARRNSLAGITGLFKNKDGEGKKGKKADMAEASVTHATVELERGSSSGNTDEMTGLSPAAKLARQHTLKSNAQAAERARQQKAVAEAQAQQAAQQQAAFDRQKNRVEEEDEDEEEEEEDSDDGTYEHVTQMTGGFDDEDMTVRLERATIQDTQDEPWAVGIRRSVERVRQPAKGILRNAINFDQEKYLNKENMPATRQRANSYTNPTQTNTEPGPLARIPSPDPDHIDGLHRSGSPHEPVLSSFSAEFGEFSTPALSLTDKPDSSGTKFNYNHPTLNSSAPVLSSIGNTTRMQRSATTPGNTRRLTFATNLSVYDTFPASTYDRRSEPATCNRLTPALAQRIKEELNSYKMEEMEVHASSRVQ
ncbi:hypothetical protein FRC10_008814 [Ceratobasidium sp. 414]|nr:hypothetical protein FRC10_008814 [Ceratobasidium sp. 414]